MQPSTRCQKTAKGQNHLGGNRWKYIFHRNQNQNTKIAKTVGKENRLCLDCTLYPVLRRLQKSECLETYDREFAGRNRRYYSITEKGCEQLEMYRREWTEYKAKIDNVLFGGISNE